MLKVNVLGKFDITNENGSLDESSMHSSMLTKLLVFLLINREKTLTSDTIAASIWQEDEVENPTGALKNLMYRLRILLKNHLGDENFIVTNRGAYSFNTKLPVEIDAEAFEKTYFLAKKEGSLGQDAIENYEHALDLYKGDFMPKEVELPWMITVNAYYHSMYLSCVKGLAEQYVKTGRFEELEERCIEALSIDYTNEELYYYLVLARMKQNKISLALKSYEKAKQILFHEVGIRKMEHLSSIYRELLTVKKGIEAEEMTKVSKDLIEENPKGAYFCGYPVFREIYRLEARKCDRMEQIPYVLLLTIKSRKELSQEFGTFYMEKMMKRLEKLLREQLRIGDVVAKYSDSQFIVLLPSCDSKGCKAVCERMICAYQKDNPRSELFPVEGVMRPVSTANKWMKKEEAIS